MNICSNLVEDFIKEGENFVFGIINDEQKVYSLEKIEKKHLASQDEFAIISRSFIE